MRSLMRSRFGDFRANWMRFRFDLDNAVRAERRQRWIERRAEMEKTGRFCNAVGSQPGAEALWFNAGCTIAEFLFRLLGIHEIGRRRALNVRRTEIALTIPQLPIAFNGYRILWVSDLHIDGMEGLAGAICNAVQGISIDLCVFGGDYRWGYAGDFREISRHISKVVAGISTRDALVALLGNHDCSSDLEVLEECGFQGLVNETIVVERGTDRLVITGTDDVHKFYTSSALNELERPKSLGPKSFGIALVHSPEFAAAASKSGYGLYLAGHTHGGQICLPGGIPIVTRLATHRKLAKQGLWRAGDMTGFTSSGAGVSGIPIRFFSHGEVTVLTLRCANGAAG